MPEVAKLKPFPKKPIEKVKVSSNQGKEEESKDEAPPSHNYEVAPFPEQERYNFNRQAEILNLQICTCGHDRMVHSCFLGRGKKRVFILDVPCAGSCLCKSILALVGKGLINCPCKKFILAKNTPIEGKRKYEAERKEFGIVPPMEK